MRAQNLTRVNSSSFLEFAKRRIIFRNFLFKDVYFQSFFVDPKFHSLYKIEERKLFCFSLVNPCHFIVLAIFSSVFKYFFYWCLLFHSFCVLCIFLVYSQVRSKQANFQLFMLLFVFLNAFLCTLVLLMISCNLCFYAFMFCSIHVFYCLPPKLLVCWVQKCMKILGNPFLTYRSCNGSLCSFS